MPRIQVAWLGGNSFSVGLTNRQQANSPRLPLDVEARFSRGNVAVTCGHSDSVALMAARLRRIGAPPPDRLERCGVRAAGRGKRAEGKDGMSA
jgi:hypothetical protein